VAVLVNSGAYRPLPPERIESLKTLVAAAIGAGQNRNVSVVDLPFEGSGTTAEGGLWRKDPWLSIAEQNGLLAMAGLLLLLGGLRPLLRALESAVVAVASRAVPVGVLSGAGVKRPAAAAARNAAGQPARAAGVASELQLVPDSDPETVRTLVLNEPGRAAQVIKEWIASDRKRLKQAG
jgi:flagellar M-ring protein FliF